METVYINNWWHWQLHDNIAVGVAIGSMNGSSVDMAYLLITSEVRQNVFMCLISQLL